VCRNLTIKNSATAPEISRMTVKLAGSILVCFSASLHSSELPANASMASEVNPKMRSGDIGFVFFVDLLGKCYLNNSTLGSKYDG
jgi:hypothetical protein